MALVLHQLSARILAAADPSQVEGLSRFFRTGPGQYGEGDKFLGIKVPVTRTIVKEYWTEVASLMKTDDGREMVFDDLNSSIASEYHEVRLAALLALIQVYKHEKALRERCVAFYLDNTRFINNWDLVDLSCYEIIGQWLLDKPERRQLLYDLATSGRTIWERRIGIVSTMAFLRKGQLDDTYAICDIFLSKPAIGEVINDATSTRTEGKMHDLLQKACGWLLREAGKRDQVRLEAYILANKDVLPRTMLRYAIEKFPPEKREILVQK